jgi:propanol-preferring alcohol dehydrogenase
MAHKMHAATVEQFGEPLGLLEWDGPSPGAGQILVKTEACGVFHTDLHAAPRRLAGEADSSLHSQP